MWITSWSYARTPNRPVLGFNFNKAKLELIVPWCMSQYIAFVGYLVT